MTSPLHVVPLWILPTVMYCQSP